ncbi:MAG: exodeoxyribonuclease V subunit alpha [Bradymonadaceae bacterium]
MKTTKAFYPTGTIRQKFGPPSTTPPPDRLPLDELLGAIALVASDEQFDAALVWTARRLVLSEVGLDEPMRSKAALLILVLLIANGEGSTRVPAAYCAEVLGRLEGHLRKARLDLDAVDNPSAEIVEKAANMLAEVRSSPLDAVLTPELMPTLVGRFRPDEIPFRPIIVGASGAFFTSERMLRKEHALGDALLGLHRRQVSGSGEAAIDAALAELEEAPTYYPSGKSWSKQALNDDQLRAVRLAATKSLTLVTGGPGTGKTTIVVAILRLLVRLGVDPQTIAFAAPTGKAANRMKESIDNQLASFEAAGQDMPEADRVLWTEAGKPGTLHRLLGYSPRYDYFRRSADDRLQASVVICDESSMIDLDLMHALIESLGEGTRLILVGDAQQLPSIAGGAVFRDLVKSMPACTARLEKSYRMNAEDGIYDFSQDVLEHSGDDDGKLKAHFGRKMEVSKLEKHKGVGRFGDKTKVSNFVKAWFTTHISKTQTFAKQFNLADGEFTDESTQSLKTVFDHYGSARILCVTRVFKTGARAINRELHKLFIETYGGARRADFVHLEPVIFLQNNYELDLFNGDQGIIARIEGAGRRLHVVFPRSDGTYRRVPLNHVRHQIEHAFAMSIHKSQGSEFKHIAVVLPKEHLPMLTKELLYTGVTRASKSVVVLDGGGVFEQGAARPVQRFTGLDERMVERSSTPHPAWEPTSNDAP